VDLILNPSASHFAFGKQEVRRRLVLEGSRGLRRELRIRESGRQRSRRAIYDGDALIATAGKVLAQAQRFSFRDHALISAVVDIDLTRVQHAALSASQPRVVSAPGECVTADFAFPVILPQASETSVEEWERSPALKEEEFARAIALGLFELLPQESLARVRGFRSAAARIPRPSPAWSG